MKLLAYFSFLLAFSCLPDCEGKALASSDSHAEEVRGIFCIPGATCFVEPCMFNPCPGSCVPGCDCSYTCL